MDLPTQILQTNGWTIGEPDDTGLRIMTRKVTSIRTGVTYSFRIERVEGASDATLIVRNRGREIARKVSDWADIANDGIAVAHQVA